MTIFRSFKCILVCPMWGRIEHSTKDMVLSSITIWILKKSGHLILVVAKRKVRDVLLSNLNNAIHFWGKFYCIVIRMGKFSLEAGGCQRDSKTSKKCDISRLFIHQFCSVQLSGWVKNEISVTGQVAASRAERGHVNSNQCWLKIVCCHLLSPKGRRK